MNTPTENVQIIRDSGGHPAFAVIPFDEYQALKQGRTRIEHTIPNRVAELTLKEGATPAKAWREHLQLTQAEVASRMGITQSAYAQLEAKSRLRKSSREKIAKAFGIAPEQLDF